jgi:hypothetical protein
MTSVLEARLSSEPGQQFPSGISVASESPISWDMLGAGTNNGGVLLSDPRGDEEPSESTKRETIFIASPFISVGRTQLIGQGKFFALTQIKKPK